MTGKTSILQRELDETRAQIAALEAALKDKPDYGLGSGASGVARWELNRAMLQQLKERVAGLEQTLSQVDEATYGICERCGQPIHPDRLAVLPFTTICIRCAQADRKVPAPRRSVLEAEAHTQAAVRRETG
jgi:RNA polymerase-binding transcription factor DksA